MDMLEYFEAFNQLAFFQLEMYIILLVLEKGCLLFVAM